jgi:hypothetical protein
MKPRDAALGVRIRVPASGRELPALIRAEDVQRLRKRLHAKPRLSPPVEIIAPELEAPARIALERDVARYLRTCGCNEGTIAGLIYIVAIPALMFMDWLAPTSVLDWIGVCAGLIGTLLAGKLAALGVARLHLNRTLHRVRRILAMRTEITTNA